jgi:hypothetical protein
MRLGVALGLYKPVESINEICWPAASNKDLALQSMVCIEKVAMPHYQEQVNALWAQMRHDFAGYIVPMRDYARWLYRYVNHPEKSYKIALISAPLTSKPLALSVMVEHPDYMELVDYVGGKDGVALAVEGARHCAGQLGKPAVKGWFTNAIVSFFEAESLSVQKVGIEVPINLRERTMQEAVLPAPLWLMAGDTDFR